ncbi:cyclic nucleotide-binding domain-containing protein [Agrobacterium sp. a22-2]|uniref:cyclic nucleotide-binding domain-containing protein n=1 Tax=Agrobacterium sp. a22-2 TaxID=2283840 RepID=UPI001446FAA9|nr:cyclic nucleotide-binding domain-containing protein [Agrobacterium sp. a22-2]NKN37534.1 cyclic nucleotide-binding domain-containing protein [Agrobacterium sp. a22-2]
MILADEVRCLRSLPLFSSVDAARLKLLAFNSERVRFSPGQVLFHQGDAGDAAYVILRGSAEVTVETPFGMVKVATIERNSLIGEISLLGDGERTATVIATTQLETLRINKENFLKLMTESPKFMLCVLEVLSSRLSRTTQELAKHKGQYEFA